MTRPHRPATPNFPSRISRNRKRSLGRTPLSATPLHVRAIGTELDPSTRSWIEDRAARRLAKYSVHIERLSFRFEDVNGPRGGRDSLCRGKAVLSGLPSTIVQKRAHTARQAFDLTSRQLARGVEKAVRNVGRVVATRSSAARGTPGGPSKGKSAVIASTRAGSLIGRRVGRARSNLLEAASRPEKLRGDAIVDTALEGVSATDRKVGARATAKRNTKLNTRRATVTLEDSATGRPSRKSTRRSANRAKSGSKLSRKVKRNLHSPKARVRRSVRR
jgi:hypothetical protein